MTIDHIIAYAILEAILKTALIAAGMHIAVYFGMLAVASMLENRLGGAGFVEYSVQRMIFLPAINLIVALICTLYLEKLPTPNDIASQYTQQQLEANGGDVEKTKAELEAAAEKIRLW